jgi:hypothetical protein
LPSRRQAGTSARGGGDGGGLWLGQAIKRDGGEVRIRAKPGACWPRKIVLGRIPLQPGKVICMWFIINMLWAQGEFWVFNLVGEPYTFQAQGVESSPLRINHNMLRLNTLH